MRAAAEAESARTSAGKLCATPFGIDVVGITEAVALLGAVVGGISARQRKAELEEVNEKLRQINISLRQQARAGVVYAPGTHYRMVYIGWVRCLTRGASFPAQG